MFDQELTLYFFDILTYNFQVKSIFILVYLIKLLKNGVNEYYCFEEYKYNKIIVIILQI